MFSANAQESVDDKHHMEKHRITVLEFQGVGVDEALLTSLADEARVALMDDLNLKQNKLFESFDASTGGYGIGYIIPSAKNLVLDTGEQVEIIFNGPKTPLP